MKGSLAFIPHSSLLLPYSLAPLLPVGLPPLSVRPFLKFPAQYFRQPLRKGRAREDVVNACLLGAPLKLGLHVREEADDWHVTKLLVRLEARGEREGVELRGVQVEDDERRHFRLGGVEERVRRARELDRDVQVLRRPANLRGEEEVADGGDDPAIHL